MKYPLRYGYSLVGRVVAVGENVQKSEYLNKLIFTFSPHSSAVIIDKNSGIIIPDNIMPEDGVFLPSMETAVSFVQSARPILGDKVLILGQGLIGTEHSSFFFIL